MRKKIFFSYFIVILVSTFIVAAAFWTKGYNYIETEGKEYNLLKVDNLAELFQQEDIGTKEEINDFVSRYSEKYNIRITIIDINGNVVKDSSNDEYVYMENHATREEVRRALDGERVSVTRFSKTMSEIETYCAIHIKNQSFEGVLRISFPQSELMKLNKELINLIIITVLISCAVAIVISIFFVRIISRPIIEITEAAEEISKGNFEARIFTRNKDQLGRLTNAFNDMSEILKKNMQNLMARNSELEAILSSMNSGVVAIDGANTIQFYNQTFVDLTYTKNSNLLSRSLYSIIRNAAIFNVIDGVRENQTTIVQEGMLSSSSNTDIAIRITGTPLNKEDERALGVLMVIEDISQIKKLENIRTEFVSNVTHELKTPLTSIKGFVETLKESEIDDKAKMRKFLDIIDIEADRLYSLIQDILLLSEIESKNEQDVRPSNIEEIISEVIELLKPKVSDKVELKLVVEGEISLYPCNPDRIKQLFINLIDNAIKSTEVGTIVVFCKEEGNELLMEVRDTGIGIEPQHFERIFERFYRVDKGRSRKLGGTGLGLSIVKHIVELYKGSVGVSSGDLEGTCFRVRLPLW